MQLEYSINEELKKPLHDNRYNPECDSNWLTLDPATVTTQMLQPFPSVACELGTFQLQYEAEAEEDNLVCSYTLA